MNKTLMFAGIAEVDVSKVVVLKPILVNSPEYQMCLSDGPGVIQACGADPFSYFILGQFVTVGGFVKPVSGLEMPAAISVSQ